MTKILIAAIVVGILISQSAFIVSEPEQALILQFGKAERIIQKPGLYMKYPLIQNLVTLDRRIIAAEARPAEYITLDKKRLTVDTVARWKIDKPLVFYQTVRSYPGAIARLNDIIFARLRQEIGNHNFKEFIREEREFIMKQVTVGTAEQAERFGIGVVDVRIKRVDLPEEVQASVFARMKAERERRAKRYRAEGDEQAREIRADANKEKEIMLAEAYKQSETLRGEGDAEATAVYAAAYGKDEEFYSFLRHLEVYKKIFGPETSLMLKPDSQLLKFLNSPNEVNTVNQAPRPASQ
ncbi:MAG TPA: protease modulator HflC [Desulfomonilaceae bacterium]|nr:protease modulator HflC [Desulfomonilaceae bacterium]